MKLSNICSDSNSTELTIIRNLFHIILVGIVIYSWVWCISRFNLHWYTIIILTPIILLVTWNMGCFVNIPIYYGCELIGLN